MPTGHPPWTLSVPAPFAAGVVERSGAPGAAWLADLPTTVARVLDAWDLVAEGPVRHGYLGLVLRVRHAGRPFALKLAEPTSPEFHDQVAALAAWRGRGMVRLERHDRDVGALLMEWLDPTASLDALDLDVAVEVASGVLRTLSVPAGPDSRITHLRDHVHDRPGHWRREQERLGRPLPTRVVDAAAAACTDLAASAGGTLVDHDLHYRDILRSDRAGWVAVDPKGVVGDAEYALGPLMWNRFDGAAGVARRFERFVDLAGLHRERARGWLLVTTVDFCLWATGIGLTRDPAACRAIAGWAAATTAS